MESNEYTYLFVKYFQRLTIFFDLVFSSSFVFLCALRYRPSNDGKYQPSNEGKYSGDDGKYDHKDVRYIHKAGESGGSGKDGSGVGDAVQINFRKINDAALAKADAAAAAAAAAATKKQPRKPPITVVNTISPRGSQNGNPNSGWAIIRQEQTDDETGYHYL